MCHTTISPFYNPVSSLFSILRKLLIKLCAGIDFFDEFVSFELRLTIFKHFCLYHNTKLHFHLKNKEKANSESISIVLTHS